MSSVNRKALIKTLRARLTVLHIATLALTLGLFAWLAYGALARTLYRHHDDELAHQAAELATMLSGRPLTHDTIGQTFVGSSVGSRFVMVRDNQGELLYRDPILTALEPTLGQHAALIHAASMGSRTPEFFTVTLERSGDVRFICVPLDGALAYVQIGDPLGDVRATLQAIARACLPLIPVVLLLSSSGGWLLAKRALHPMRAMTVTLEDIRATDLSRRVDVTSTDGEVADLAATLNHLLDRLQRAFDALRQFAGDVSHQIQTPLTVMKSSIETALRRSDPGADDVLLQHLSDEIRGISATVAELQSFALADAPLREPKPVGLSQVVQESVDIISALGELKGISVRSEIASDVVVQGDAIRLKQVVLNLGDNAVKYTREGGRVSVTVHAEPHHAVVRVTDSGVGIAQEHLPRIFDRLFRADAADRSTRGAGLGLAIAKRIIDVHRGTINVESREGRGTTFTVRLPRM